MSGMNPEQRLPSLERNVSLARKAIILIREAIVSGTLPAGSQLSVNDIAGRLGVSQTPVREALMFLDATGLLNFQSGQIVIPEPTPDRIRSAYEARAALESMTARLAALRREDAEGEKLLELAEQTLTIGERGDAAAFRKLDMRFHEAIAASARSPQLEHYTRHSLAVGYTVSSLRLLDKSFKADAAHMHVRIAQAIIEHDPHAAEAAAREHVLAVADSLVTTADRAETTGSARRVPGRA